METHAYARESTLSGDRFIELLMREPYGNPAMDRTLLMTDHDLTEIVANAVDKALAPLERRLDKIESKAEFVAERVKAEAERTARIATEDRERLARQVRDDSREHARNVAEEIVSQMMKSLGIDADNPSEFMQDMVAFREFRAALKASKAKALTVFIGIIMSGLCAGIWTAVKSGLKP